MIKLLIFVTLLGLTLSFPERLYTPPSFGSTTKKPAAGSATVATVKPGSKNDPAAVPSGPGNPFNLTFVVSARDLPVKKKGAKLDSYVKVSHKTATLQNTGDWIPIGQTETLKDTVNPTFLKVFTFEWTKGFNQKWHFEVKEPHTLSKDVLIGQADVTIDEYVLQKSQDMTVKLSEGGSLVIKKVEPVSFRLYARMVPKMDPLNGASDPFVVCSWRIGKDGNNTEFYKTKVVKDSENPDWNETIEFPNYQKRADMWWHFKVYDEDSVSGNDVVGEALVEIDPFVEKRAAKSTPLSKDPKNKATLTVTPA
jgi:hypothetical protein